MRLRPWYLLETSETKLLSLLMIWQIPVEQCAMLQRSKPMLNNFLVVMAGTVAQWNILLNLNSPLKAEYLLKAGHLCSLFWKVEWHAFIQLKVSEAQLPESEEVVPSYRECTFNGNLMVQCISLPPASAVEVIESVPSFCLSVCPSVSLRSNCRTVWDTDTKLGVSIKLVNI